jgi:hypothetical protein
MQDGQSFTGLYGLVLLPDEKTRNHALQLAHINREKSHLDLGGRHEPHLTLYHAKLAGVPSSVVNEYLDTLAASLPMPLTFTRIARFGGTFLFWDIERTEQLMGAHEFALGLSQYFDASGSQPLDKEKVTLSPEESSNVKKFGHPLVHDLWRPHITIGFFPDGISEENHPEVFEGGVTDVAFARMGEAGTIAEIVARGIRTPSSA